VPPAVDVPARALRDPALQPVAERVRAGERLSDAEALVLFKSHDLLGVGALADAVNRAKNGNLVTFAANQHINPTNVCILRKTCVFCGYARLPKEDGAYRYTLDQVMAVHHAVGDFAALARERYFTGRRDTDQAVTLQAADGHGHRGRRNLEPAGQRGGDNHFAFAFGLRDGLQVILFRNRDAHSLVIVICGRA